MNKIPFKHVKAGRPPPQGGLKVISLAYTIKLVWSQVLELNK